MGVSGQHRPPTQVGSTVQKRAYNRKASSRPTSSACCWREREKSRSKPRRARPRAMACVVVRPHSRQRCLLFVDTETSFKIKTERWVDTGTGIFAIYSQLQVSVLYTGAFFDMEGDTAHVVAIASSARRSALQCHGRHIT